MATPGSNIPQGPSEGFKILSVAPATHFITDHVDAPTELYVTADQFLRVLGITFAALASITVRYRLLRSDDGQVVLMENTFTLPGDGFGHFLDIQLPEGFLLSVWCTLSGTTAVRGNSYMTVQLWRGKTSTPTFLQTLVADSPNTAGSLGWPGGSLRASTEGPGFLNAQSFAAPAAGAEINLAVVNGQRWRVQALRFSLTTSAAVANRVVNLVHLSSSLEVFRVPISGVIAASTTQIFTGMPGAGSPSLNNGVNLLPLPGLWELMPNDVIATVTTNLQAGDQYSIQNVSMEQWISS